ncbi:uncharacterized protein [Hetaerina americana]|uniref:uncharacterized protein n=1 Tax=Hetaerina americana TaxID=62018 RepID=UPI003A7F2159
MMTTVGRGRGNWGSKDVSAPLRRPGESSRASGGEEDIIMRELENLDISDQRKFETIEDQIRKYCVNREHLWKICQKMYEAGAKDRSMIQKVVKFWSKLSFFEINDVKLRSVLMSTAQKDFEEREEIREHDPERFLNAIALFGGIFHHMTLPGGGVFIVLVTPMIEYLELLLKEGSKDKALREAELEMLANQVNLNGQLLKEHAKENLEEFSLQIRRTLGNSQPSSKCYYWLLLILDITLHGWNSQGFPNFLKTFYSEKLGDSFNDLTISEASQQPLKNESKNIIKRINIEGSSIVSRKIEITPSTENNSQNRDFSNDKPSRKVWNDGSGDHKERRKPPYWGHDDRFDDVGDSGTGRGHNFTERGGKRGGGGGWANWRDRGDSRSHRSSEDGSGRRWNNEPQSGHKPYVTSTESEERWD